MTATPVIAIFDLGKTNKKLFLIDEQYKIVWERTDRLEEIADEDGYPCENIDHFKSWLFEVLEQVLLESSFSIRAINFSTYGASLVYIGNDGKPVAPLYNYLKPYPAHLKNRFYSEYGGEEDFSIQTASPVLGSLNSGLQLYRIKYESPALYRKIKYALHLPQYMSFLITGKCFSDLTSIGSHTALWDFNKNQYHFWVHKEKIETKLAPIASPTHVEFSSFQENNYPTGIGLHDSSAALIPYVVNFQEPFVMISTGTWCISLNPFNHDPLTYEELKNDCLCYLTIEGKPVKASRLFAGQEHEEQCARIASYFGLHPSWYNYVEFDHQIISQLKNKERLLKVIDTKSSLKQSLFSQREINLFGSAAEAYHQLILDIIHEQYNSSQLVIKGTSVKRIFVDGGFSKNSVYMHLLASAFPDMEVYAASVSQATAIGAALVLHQHWNNKPLPNDIIELKYYSLTRDPII